MPIRSPRGRSAAYRGLWQWPLRSPARLAVTAAVVVAVVAGLAGAVAALGGSSSDGGPIAPEGSAGSTTTAPPVAGRSSPASPTALPPVPELAPTTLPLAQAPAAALEVAARWSAAWVDHPEGTTSQQWLAGLRAHTTDEYLGVLAGVDPANVPATRITGEPRPVLVAARSVRVEVPTDAVTLLVLVVDTGTGWRVAGYDEA